MDPIAIAIAQLQSQGLLGPTPQFPAINDTPTATNLMAPGTDPVAPLTDISGTPLPVPVSDRIAGSSEVLGQPPAEGPGPVPTREFNVGVDQFGAERGEPDLAGTAGYDPKAPEFTPPRSFGYGDVGGAEREMNDQVARVGASNYAATDAKFKAEQDLQKRLADSYQKAADEQVKADQDHQRLRAEAQRAADMETAAWLDQITTASQREPDPGRWFESRNSLGKALWGLGLAFSAIHAGITPGAKNAVLEMVRQEIDKDVALQQQRMEKELAALRLRGTMMDKRHQRVLSDLSDDHARRLSRIQALEKAWVARAGVPGDAQKAASLAEAQVFFDNLKLTPIQAMWQMKHQEKESAAQRAHAATQNRLAREQAQRQHDDEMDYKYWSKTVDASMTAGAKGAKLPETRGTAFDVGFVLTDAKGNQVGDGTVRTRDEKSHQELNELGTAASDMYVTLEELANAIEKQSDFKTIAGIPMGELDPEINRLATKIAYAAAKENDPGGRFSEMDVSKGALQKLGFDPTGKTWDRAKFAANKGAIVELLKKDRENLSQFTSKRAAKYLDTEVNGQNTRILFSPQAMRAQKPVTKNAAERMGKVAYQMPKDLKEYRKGLEAEKDETLRGTILPEHDQGAVSSFEAAVKGRSPEFIAQEAKKVLAKFRKDPWSGAGETTFADENTAKVIEMVADEHSQKAARVLKRLEERAYLFNKTRPVTIQNLRSMAKNEGLTDVGAEVKAIFDRIHKK